MNIFEEKMPDAAEQKPVKVAQSMAEKNVNFAPGQMGDFNARSVEHVGRPRYGHKV